MVYRKPRSKKGKRTAATRYGKRRHAVQPRIRKRLISRKAKKKKTEIVSRKGQPQITAEIERIKREEYLGGYVSSSWIGVVEWIGDKAHMITLDDYEYDVYIPFSVFEMWYYAHSKGTFFNYMIKDKYKVVRA